MMSDSIKRSNFNDKILPHLEELLQFSLSLTKNGRDAAKLMRETLDEAFKLWDESIPKESSIVWLRKILSQRFSKGFLQHTRQTILIPGDAVEESPVENNRLRSVMTFDARKQSWLTSESDEDDNYFKAFVRLPEMFRSVMILSYLEGFSNTEIANLAGVEPNTVESLLDRGRRLLQIELFAHLMGNTNFCTVRNRAMASR